MNYNKLKNEEEKYASLTYTTNDFNHSVTSLHGHNLTSHLDTLLMKKWLACEAAGAFIYSVDDVKTKVLPGKYGIVAQMNEKRKLMRRKPESITDIHQPFNPDRFNFTKIQDKEILLKLKFSEPKEGSEGLEATLIINNAPILHSHSLLVPSLESCQPQVLNQQGLITAVHTLLLSSTPDLRISYNSLGGYASVNHLHFHVFFLPYTTYTEVAECERLAGPCYTFKNHFAPGFVFQMEDGDVEQLVRSVMKLVSIFLKENVAHNVYITRGPPLEGVLGGEGTYSTVRVALWAQEFVKDTKTVGSFTTAVCELSGHLPVYSPGIWDTLSEQDVLPVITAACKEKYEAILPKVIDAFQLNSL